jgi:hypothetical protein
VTAQVVISCQYGNCNYGSITCIFVCFSCVLRLWKDQDPVICVRARVTSNTRDGPTPYSNLDCGCGRYRFNWLTSPRILLNELTLYNLHHVYLIIISHCKWSCRSVLHGVSQVKRSLKLGQRDGPAWLTSERGAVDSWFPSIDGLSLPTTSR